MRATFTTSFIYDGADGFEQRRQKIEKILGGKCVGGGNMIGQISGITSGLDLRESDVREYIEEIVRELHRISKADFKVVWLLEGGDIIIKKVRGKLTFNQLKELK